MDRIAGAGNHSHRFLHQCPPARQYSGRVGRAARRYCHRLDRRSHGRPAVSTAIKDIAIGFPDLRVDMLWHGLSDLAPLLRAATRWASTTSPKRWTQRRVQPRRATALQPAQRAACRRRGRVGGSAFGSPFPAPPSTSVTLVGRTRAAGSATRWQAARLWKDVSSSSWAFSACCRQSADPRDRSDLALHRVAHLAHRLSRQCRDYTRSPSWQRCYRTSRSGRPG